LDLCEVVEDNEPEIDNRVKDFDDIIANSNMNINYEKQKQVMETIDDNFEDGYRF